MRLGRTDEVKKHQIQEIAVGPLTLNKSSFNPKHDIYVYKTKFSQEVDEERQRISATLNFMLFSFYFFCIILQFFMSLLLFLRFNVITIP